MDNFWGTGRFWNTGKTAGRKSHLKVVTSDGGLKETSVKPRIRPKPMCLIPKEPA